MAVDTFSITNSYVAYIRNMPYIYPNDNVRTMGDSTPNLYNTGWHILPTMLWKHFVTPKQWMELLIKAEAYHVDSISTTLFNMVPMTTQLAIQGTNVFTAFNNTIYAMGYTDELYETSWQNWFPQDAFNLQHSLLYKEGLVCVPNGTEKKRNMLPEYSWRIPNPRGCGNNTYNCFYDAGTGGWSAVYPSGSTETNTSNFDGRPTGVLWDPMNRPDKLMELRPGKNAISFSWSCHPTDDSKWFNLDMIAQWYPYTPEGPYNVARPRPGQYHYTTEQDPDRVASRWERATPINDYTMPNYADLPVVPMAWWWQEMKESISPANLKTGWQLQYMDLFFTGTEREQYMYGPYQHFVKIIPIFDSAGTHIECSALIGVKQTLNLKIKQRRSALFAPTWGPFNWYNTYSAKTSDLNFTGAWIRYRTAGMRRTWQNLGDSNNAVAHPRETPFNVSTTNSAGTGQDGTRTTVTYTMAGARRRPFPSAPPMETEEEGRVPITTSGIQPLEHITGHRV